MVNIDEPSDCETNQPLERTDKPSSADWETRKQLLKILEPFHVIEAQMEQYPSSNPLDQNGNHSMISKGKEQRADMLKKIWGDRENHSIFAANTMQHIALFCIPAIAASAHLMQKTRYRHNEDFSTESSRTANFLAKAVLPEQQPGPEEDFSTFALAHHHLPPKDREHWNLEPKTVHQRPVHHPEGIPHAAMAYSLYESLRAAEFIAERQGQPMSVEECEIHYQYFAEILRRSGYRCPLKREDMETIAEQIDALAGKSPTSKDLVLRAMKHLNIYDQNIAELDRAYPPRSSLTITQASIRDFLRPHTQEAFDAIMKESTN